MCNCRHIDREEELSIFSAFVTAILPLLSAEPLDSLHDSPDDSSLAFYASDALRDSCRILDPGPYLDCLLVSLQAGRCTYQVCKTFNLWGQIRV